ncbi:hypothetical protein YDYSG_60800 [Paenibacillus tyrfis]|nr:hypothetical protein YDYSG_60800 [Paenibacillus tyrfis]
MINVRQRTSIYQTIDRLLRDGLIAVRETLKEPGKPDRTVYESTEDGRKLFREWLRDMLSVPSQEFPDFPVAVSFLSLLTPDDVLQQLERRSSLLEKEIQRVSSDLQTYKDTIPRLFMLETEYKRAVLMAEWQWVLRRRFTKHEHLPKGSRLRYLATGWLSCRSSDLTKRS